MRCPLIACACSFSAGTAPAFGLPRRIIGGLASCYVERAARCSLWTCTVVCTSGIGGSSATGLRSACRMVPLIGEPAGRPLLECAVCEPRCWPSAFVVLYAVLRVLSLAVRAACRGGPVREGGARTLPLRNPSRAVLGCASLRRSPGSRPSCDTAARTLSPGGVMGWGLVPCAPSALCTADLRCPNSPAYHSITQSVSIGA